MAELIGTISAVASLVDLSGKVLSVGYGYLSKVARAPTEMRTLLSEVASLNAILDQLQSLTLEDCEKPSAKTAMQTLSQLQCFDTCESLLKSVGNSIKACEQVNGHDLKNLGRKLLWPFKERETKEVMQQLNRLRDTFSAALAVDSAAALKRIVDTGDRIDTNVTSIKDSAEAQLEAARTQSLYQWLCPDNTNPEESFEAALQLRYHDTGQWFLDSDAFKSWLESSNSLFWLHGIPGCGKTVLSAIVIETLLQRYDAREFRVTFFYCDHGNPNKRTLRNFLMTVVSQLLRAQSDCFVDASVLFKNKYENTGRTPTAPEYISMIRSMSLRFRNVFVIVDALDESSEEEDFIKAFRDLVKDTHHCSNLKVLVTSRSDISIERLISPLATYRSCFRDVVGEDIRTYVRGEVDRRLSSRQLKLRDPAVADQIMEVLTSRADGQFLQARLQLEYICTLTTDRAIKITLSDLPHKLDQMYDRILEQICSKHPSNLALIKNMLQWLIGSAELLKLDQLACAVSVQAQDTKLDLENIATDPEDLVAMCGSLIVIDKSYSAPLVKLSHFSVWEYLCSDRLAKSHLRFFHMDLYTIGLTLASRCSQYLGFSDFADPEEYLDFDKRRQSPPLTGKYHMLEYAAQYWATHLKYRQFTSEDYQQKLSPYLEWFLTGDSRYSTWRTVLSCIGYPPIGYEPPIYFAIVLALEQVFDQLIPSLLEINAQFSSGSTPLTLAAKCGQLGIARKLLQVGADPNVAANSVKCKGFTALHLSAVLGNGEMTAMLLTFGASPHARSTNQSTPFYRAVRSGSIPILKMLYKAGADINARTYDDLTPLIEAVEGNHLDVLKLLLRWGAHPNVASSDGNTALSFARWLGHDEMATELENAMVSLGIHFEPADASLKAPTKPSTPLD
ncbi:hypothetical protein MMC28_006823 [Mycoblastus sanguinarius]|nr:hypothetical protein [Mycoblastus sanguinarius]